MNGIVDFIPGTEGSGPKPSAPAALEIHRLTRRWPGQPPVFSDLSLSVPDTGITVLLGPSGCGKSTLLRCAASLDRPEAGRISVDGIPARHPSPDRILILQDDNQLLPWLTVGANVAFDLPGARNVSREVRQAASADLLSLVDLPDAGFLYPAQLSGGMRQRAVLARALAARPRILLLDEPFAALDSAIRGRLQRLLARIQKEENTAMLLVTHDVNEALILGDTIVFMGHDGTLSDPEANPLGSERDSERPEFHAQAVATRRRYAELIDPKHL